jgi:hypothetical protein
MNNTDTAVLAAPLAADPEQQGAIRKAGSAATQFRPGQSGNPGGRPKGKTMLTRIREILTDEPDEAEAIARAFIECCKRGSWAHIKELIDREAGKVPERFAGPDGGAIQAETVKARFDSEGFVRLLLAAASPAEQHLPTDKGDL